MFYITKVTKTPMGGFVMLMMGERTGGLISVQREEYGRVVEKRYPTDRQSLNKAMDRYYRIVGIWDNNPKALQDL